MKTLFLIAGERSGDTHGAALIEGVKKLAPDWSYAGLGGSAMRAAGGEDIEDWAEEAGVVGLWEVLKKYGYFREKFDQTLARIRQRQPSAVILIDYPGFNLRMAKALHRAGDRAIRIYYISPQVWAWNRSRIPAMARVLDHMLCIFPFEKPLYESTGLETQFVGHPLVDELEGLRTGEAREVGLLGLFPGSREREVAALFPVMLDAARILRDQHPGELRVAASAATGSRAGLMEKIRTAQNWTAEECPIEVGTSRELMQRATAGVVASGTATLEAAFFGLPYCLVYKVAWLTYAVGKAVIRVDHLGIVNILAGREIVKELVQSDAVPQKIAASISSLLDSPEKALALQDELADIVAKLGGGGAHEKAARAVFDAIGNPPEEKM